MEMENRLVVVKIPKLEVEDINVRHGRGSEGGVTRG